MRRREPVRRRRRKRDRFARTPAPRHANSVARPGERPRSPMGGRPSAHAPDRHPKGRDPKGLGELGRDRRIAALASRAGRRSAIAGRWLAFSLANSPIKRLSLSIIRGFPHFLDAMSGYFRASEVPAKPCYRRKSHPPFWVWRDSKKSDFIDLGRSGPTRTRGRTTAG